MSDQTLQNGHYRRPVERPFLRSERDRVQILIGGLTERHNQFLYAAGTGLGYRGTWLPTPTKADYETGREYCDTGLCSPTYFTVGSLINYLKRLRDQEGIPVSRILDEYVFFTAGATGPCRFGMYEAQFRLALRNAGFEGFRVLVFQQKAGADQPVEQTGLEVNAEFMVVTALAVMLGDLINDLAFRIRPYETVKGRTNEVLDHVTETLGQTLHNWAKHPPGPSWKARALARIFHLGDATTLQRVLDIVYGIYWTQHLRAAAEAVNRGVSVDYTRPKPLVKLVGEFWVKRTDGDGNHQILEFLESEGAEVIIEPLITWFDYLLSSTLLKHKQNGPTPHPATVGARIRHASKKIKLHFASYCLKRAYERLRKPLGSLPHPLPDQAELQRLAKPFINPELSGGEGHLEVGEVLYYGLQRKAHLILGLRPFGCLPSTQSDGVQATVLAQYPEIAYVSLEIVGNDESAALSRVQMALDSARQRCLKEFEGCIKTSGRSQEAIQAYCRRYPSRMQPLRLAPATDGVTGTAACFVLDMEAPCNLESSDMAPNTGIAVGSAE